MAKHPSQELPHQEPHELHWVCPATENNFCLTFGYLDGTPTAALFRIPPEDANKDKWAAEWDDPDSNELIAMITLHIMQEATEHGWGSLGPTWEGHSKTIDLN